MISHSYNAMTLRRLHFSVALMLKVNTQKFASSVVMKKNLTFFSFSTTSRQDNRCVINSLKLFIKQAVKIC